MTAARLARLVAVGIGAWLVVAPAFLDHGATAADNDRAVGPLIAAFAFVALWAIVEPLRWVTLPLGAWLLVAPFVLGHDDGLVIVNSIACGAVTAAAAAVGGGARRSFGGGWRSLVGPPERTAERGPHDRRRPPAPAG